ncbi:MAG: hypothetical protein K5867_05615 [Bacteroidales bacterium]|nr:hypothetical protein [Bacteroidales bacterium]
MKHTFRLLALVCLVGGMMLTSCKKDPEENGGNGGNGGNDITDATSLSGTINDNRTLSDLGLPVDYIVDGYLYLEGNAMLTVEPGVTIMFANEGSAIIVGDDQGIRMVGTADKPIILTGPTNNQNKGSWKFISVRSNRNDNAFEYVQFNNGGADGAVIFVDGKLSMKHCTINGSLGNGVNVGGNATLTAFENNTIMNVNQYPISMEVQAAPQLGTGNTYTANGKNMIELFYHWVSENSYTINAQPIPFYVSDGIGVDENASLTLGAGVEMVFPYNQDFVVSDGSILNIQGTATNPVILRSMGNGNDEWIGLEFNSSRNGSSISYCFIDGAGKESDGAALYLGGDARISLTNVTVRNSSSYGMSIYYDEESPSDFHVTSTGHSFLNCASGDIYNRYTEQVMDQFPN